MRRAMILGLGVLLPSCSAVKAIPPADQTLTIKARCGGSDPCVFSGAEVFIDIAIINASSKEIGFPLAFNQKTGPSIHLTDPRTGKDTWLRTNPADFSLAARYTPVLPGQPVSMEWVITAGEIAGIAGPTGDVMAEILVASKIQVEDRTVDFTGKDTLRIRMSRKP